MSHKSFRMIAVLSLVILGACLATQPAAAQQQGWPYNPQNRWWERGSNGFSQNNRATYIRSAPVIVSAEVSTKFQLQVPVKARVWFEGQPTAQAGMSRSFVSPPLQPGVVYHYAIRVEWREGDRAIKRDLGVDLKAGDRLSLDFNTQPVSVSR
jgi:uncharacterized protein (TIGR03000 family)